MPVERSSPNRRAVTLNFEPSIAKLTILVGIPYLKTVFNCATAPQ